MKTRLTKVKRSPLLLQREQFSALRTARIINQAASALSEVHENDIPHRRLTPEDIILTVSEEGSAQVKLTNFGIFEEENPEQNLTYTAPKQLEGNPADISSDTYSLAVIAYQMLTGRFPHNANSAREMLKVQGEGLKLVPSNMRFDVKPPVDEILEKALSSDISWRYPKARDFGDAFFNAISTVAPGTEEEIKKSSIFAEEFELDEVKTNYFTKPEVKEPEIPEFEIIEETEIVEEESFEETSSIPQPSISFVLNQPIRSEELKETEKDIDTKQRVFAPILMPTKALETTNPSNLIKTPTAKKEDSEVKEEKIPEEIARENLSEKTPWKRRSIEGKQESHWKTAALSLFGLLILIARDIVSRFFLCALCAFA